MTHINQLRKKLEGKMKTTKKLLPQNRASMKLKDVKESDKYKTIQCEVSVRIF